MTHSFAHIRARVLACCLALACCFALGGCFEKTVLREPVQTPPRPPVAAQPGVLTVEEAEAALNAGQTARAEQLAMRLVARPGLTESATARAARVLALAAAANKHHYLAMNALERWHGADPAAQESPEWQTVFFDSLGQMPPREGTMRAQSVMTDTQRPYPMRSGAALFLASRQWERAAEAPQALANIEVFYGQIRDKAHRAHMEHALFSLLQNTGELTLGTLDALVTDENSKTFPHAIIRLETLRRKALRADTREEAQAGAGVLAQDTALADPGILRQWDAAADTSVMTVPLSGKTLVLVLPLSGPLGGIGKKIAAGADEAKKEFAAAGYTVNVVKLDTRDPAWLDRLAAMPPQAVIVGGPLRTDDFSAANARGLTASRVFMTFLPSLGEAGEEGGIAWRFFPSPEDQFSALFAAAGRLGITGYAILMPDNDPYAANMAARFTAHAENAGGRVVKRAEYPGAVPADWNKSVASFLGTDKNATHAPAVAHRAVFLPDSWRNMELIVPNLFYFMETRQLLLGTTLWEQGLSTADHVAAHYYRLAVFPGAWDRTAALSQASARLQAAYAAAGLGEPDFWAGLGYDFVRFASTLDIGPGWTAASVNTTLSRSGGIAWSLAPLRWSPQGRASQSLFLLTPDTNGAVPADMKIIEERFNKAWNP